MISNSSKPLFNVASIKMCTEALGPFKRMSIWFQGCDIGCRGCCNPELQPMEPRNLMSLNQILSIAQQSKIAFGIEGVTFIGGEPTLQKSLFQLARALKSIDLGIILFTGRDVEELPDELKTSVDLIIDGRFIETDRDYERNLVGSTNQRIIDVSSRYSDHLEWFNSRRADFIEIDVVDEHYITNGSSF